MSTPLLVVGAGGFGRETLDVVEAVNASAPSRVWDVVGVLDDAVSDANRERLAARSVPVLGRIDDFLRTAVGTASYVVAIGSPAVRRRIASRFDDAGMQAATLVHPSVTCGALSTFGSGTVICAGVTVSTNVVIGRHVHINPGATLGHDTRIHDYVSINPLAGISGDCVIESGVLIGVGGVVLNGLRIGGGATVGGSACVVRDVPAGTTVVGVPAKPVIRG